MPQQIPRPVYKPHFVRGRTKVYAASGVVPWRPDPGQPSIWASGLPEPQAADPELKRGEQPLVPAWPCSWWGLPGRRHYCRRRWSLTPPFHPYRRAADCTLRRYVSVARSGRLPRPGSYPAPCAVECGLSSTRPEPCRSCPTDLGKYCDGMILFWDENVNPAVGERMGVEAKQELGNEVKLGGEMLKLLLDDMVVC